MNMKLLWLLTVFFLACFGLAEAQQPTKVPRIAYLFTVSLSLNTDRIEAFRQGLRELGYFEGKNITIAFRTAEGKLERYPELLAELVRLNVDIILVGGNSGIRAAKEATSTIPIIMTSVGDPVALGLVASLARPGGNITGLTQMAPDLTGKRLELLKEILPKVTRVAFIRDPTNPGMTLRFRKHKS
jgi:putative ABC transport system substrate-binding protein